jgi:restriction endonuclease S subunit
VNLAVHKLWNSAFGYIHSWYRVQDHFFLLNGFPFQSEDFNNDGRGMPLVRIRDILSDNLPTYFNGEEGTDVIVTDGDIVIGMDGDFNTVTWNKGDALLNQRVCALRPKKPKGVDPRILGYQIPISLKIINDLTPYSTVKHLSSFDVLSLRFPLPDLPTQHAIADFLDLETARIDSLIEKKQRLVDGIKNKLDAEIFELITEGIGKNEMGAQVDLGWKIGLPKHWRVRKVKYLFQLVVNPAPKNNNEELLSIYTAIGVRPRKDLEAKGNKASTTDGYWFVKKGDIIVNKLLAWMGAIGVSDYNGVTSPAYDVLRAKEVLEPYYYHYLFRIPQFALELKRRSRGIMDMRLRLYFDRFGQILVPVPPSAEQRSIVDALREQEEKYSLLVSKIRQSIDCLKEYRSALITAAAALYPLAYPEHAPVDER